MKKEVIPLFLIILFILIIFPVNAQEPFQQDQSPDFTEGFIIKIPEQGTILLNENYTFRFRIYNKSNGVILTSADPLINDNNIHCYFNLYNSFGNILYGKNNTLNEGYDYEFSLNQNNFSTQGQYSYVIQCLSSNESLGGFESVGFIVSNKKLSMDIGESIMYVILTVAIFLVFLLSLYFTIITPFLNKRDENDGSIVKIVKLKYVKLFLIMFTYAMFVWFFNVLIGIADNFVSLSLYYGFVSFMFELMLRLALPFSIVILIIAGINILKDMNVQKEIKKWGKYKG